MSHIMLQSDTLANEFNEILNGVEIFAPFQPLDPAVTFYAPLRTTVRDLRLNPDDFQRNSDAWYKDGNGLYRHVGINRPRFEEGRLLMEPALTNKNTNYNARPDVGATNLIVSGSGTLQRVYDPELFYVLGDLTDGWCWELSGFGGSTALEFGGGTGNTNLHTGSAWCKMIVAPNNDPFLRIGTVAPQKYFNNTTWERIVTTEFPDQSRLLRLQCPTDTVARIVMNQLEESPVATSPIVTEGTAGQRALDDLRYENLLNFFNLSEGMLIYGFRPIVASADYPLDSFSPIVTMLAGSINGASYVRKTAGGAVTLSSYDGTNAPASVSAVWAALDPLWVAVRFGSGEKQIGVYDSGWSWGGIQAHSDFANDGNLYIHDLPIVPTYLHDIEVYNEDRGTAWIEANYP